ncbi:hypothetical protein BH24ACT26_BH24ACT26_06110 [soil metagenome]
MADTHHRTARVRAARTAGLCIALVLMIAVAWPTFLPFHERGSAASAKVTRLLRRLDPSTKKPLGPAPMARQRAKLASRQAPVRRQRSSRFIAASSRPAALGKLRIPAIGLTTDFFSGVHADILERGPGLWPGTHVPGEVGNAVLSGHRTTHTHPFRDLDRLDTGDVIRTTTGGGEPIVFKVFSTATVAEENYVRYILRRPRSAGARTLTLFACHPKGQRTHRIVVKARAAMAPSGSHDLDKPSDSHDLDRKEMRTSGIQHL